MVYHIITHFSVLCHFAEHDNGFALILPDHLPEVIHSILHWNLSCNVGPSSHVALYAYPYNIRYKGMPLLTVNAVKRFVPNINKAGIDVVLISCCSKHHSVVVVCNRGK